VVTLLFVRGFLSGTRTDPGFSERNLLLVTVSPETSHLGRAGARDYYRRLQERVSALPEVRATSLAAHPPLGLSGGGMTIPVRRPEAADADPDGLRTRYNVVEPRYFDALGIRLLAGRDFNDHEDEDAQRVTIVSEALARRYWPGQDPLGRTLSIGASPAEYEVVGVAQDVAVIGMNETPEPYLYLPYRQTSAGFMTLLVAVRGSPALLAPAVRQAMRAVDDGVAPFSVETMPDLVHFALMPQWIGAWSGAALGGLTVVLAVGGLFALVAYAVSRRTHEIGIRMALGARRRTTLWMVVRQGLYLGLAGVGLGLPLAVALGYVLRSLFFGIAPADPPALAGASLAVVAVALLASLGPAHRATRVDPMTALRSE
jgi:predicted permease